MRQTGNSITNNETNTKNKINRENLTAVFLLLAIFINLISSAAAQSSGGTYAITKSVVSSGGTGNAQQSSGGTFAVAGTIGQSVAGDGLTGGGYTISSGFWSPTVYNVGLEGNLAARPSGTDEIGPNDVVFVRQLVNGTATVDPEYNEFQRADTAPRADFGDGSIDANDVIQTRRYLNGSEPTHVAAGPTEKTVAPRSADQQKSNASVDDYASEPRGGTPRRIRVESTSGIVNQQVTVNIRVDAIGNEAGYSFIINYDKTKLTNPVIGAGNANAGVRACNVNFATGINCAVDTFPNDQTGSTDPGIGEIAPGDNQILISVTFRVAATAPPQVDLTLSSVRASNDNADSLPISGADGVVTVSGGPTAAPVFVGGQIVSASGKGIRNVTVQMTDANGQTRTVASSEGGRFRFENVPAGAVYIFTTAAKRFRLMPDRQILMINEDTDNITFVEDALDAPHDAPLIPPN